MIHKIRQMFFAPRRLSSRAAYALWASSYPPVPHNRFMEIEQATMLDLLPPLPGARVLDLACGSGRWGRVAAARGAARVISLDDSAAMLQHGRPPLAILGSMDAPPLPAASVDCVICGLAIGHTPHIGAVLAGVARVLAPGGVALFSDVHPHQAWNGAQRTFAASDGRTLAVEHHIHSYADYHGRAGLRVDAVREVSAQSGKPPVLLVVKLGKM